MPDSPLLYGFTNFSPDVLGTRLINMDVPVVNAAIDASLAQHTRELNLLTSLFVTPVTSPSERHLSVGADMLQPLDEYGRALPVKGGVHQDVAYPLQKAGTALGLTYEARAKLTVQELNNIVSGRTTADARWMRYHIMAALFAKNGWNFTDPKYGALSIKGLADGDSDTYLIQDGVEVGATSQHYLAQANPIDDANNPFASDYELLMSHPENSGQAVALVAHDLIASVQNLADFKPVVDSNIRNGIGESVLVGNVGVSHPGTLIGYVNQTFIVDWRGIPSGNILTVATGGDRALGFRQDDTPALQGFIRAAERNDHPYYETQYLRIAGFGARNRVNALVRRIGNAAYAIPTGFESPMP